MGYENASTVEIIIDMLFSDFDFVEMNTQLQVIISSYLIFFKKNFYHHVMCNLTPCLIYNCGVFYVF
jgi:hypothetical protein